MDDLGLRRTQIWDLPTRLFHWCLVLLMIGAYVTAKGGMIAWHFRCGYAILTLVLFRIAWGIVGSDTSRFATFVRTPLAALRHLSRFGRREPDREVGHNAAGGLMVLILLLMVLIQAGTGLFANDGLFESGPLAERIAPPLSDTLTAFHAWNFNLILVVVTAHVVAVFAYALVKRQNLVRPMITGAKMLPRDVPAPRMGPLWLALPLFGVAATLVWWISSLG